MNYVLQVLVFYLMETIWLNSLDMHDIAFVTQSF